MKKLPVVSFVGKSGSGKTTLMEKVIAILKESGYRVGTVKHTHHDAILDIPGKDSFRHRASGAELSILVAAKTVSFVRSVERPPELFEILERYAEGLDIALIEGFSANSPSQIVVSSEAISSEQTKLYKNIVAVASGEKSHLDVPCFSRDDAKGVADFIRDLTGV